MKQSFLPTATNDTLFAWMGNPAELLLPLGLLLLGGMLFGFWWKRRK